MKRRFLWFLLILIGNSFFVNGQYISRAMLFERPVLPADSNSISFTYQNLFYLRDFEYYNNIQTGWTAFGTWHDARLTLQPHQQIKFQVGVLAQKEFGDLDLNRTIPFFSFEYRKNNSRLLFGMLEGHQNHQLIEPMMHYDQVYEHPHEEGIQYKVNKKNMWLDVWLDWERRQLINDINPEKLTAGLSSKLNIGSKPTNWKLVAPTQIIVAHKGGQLNTLPVPVTTTVNYAQGLWFEWNNNNSSHWLQQIRTDAYYVGHGILEAEKLQPYSKGHGILWNAFIQSKWNVFLSASYWNGHHFISAKGGQLYESVSTIFYQPNYTEPNRELFLVNLGYDKELLPQMFMNVRISPYRDFNNGINEISAYLMFSYRGNFKLGKLKK